MGKKEKTNVIDLSWKRRWRYKTMNLAHAISLSDLAFIGFCLIAFSWVLFIVFFTLAIMSPFKPLILALDSQSPDPIGEEPLITSSNVINLRSRISPNSKK